MELTDELLRYLIEVTPGNFAIYRLDGTAFEPLYLSPALPSLNGMTMGEFTASVGNDASGAVLPQDMPMLLDALRECVETGKMLDCFFRVRHKTLGFDWAHANARLCGERDGKPVFLVVYLNDPAETDLYRGVLDHLSSMAYVCDCSTYEILYANRAAREYRRGESENFIGKTCHAYIQGKDRPCADCFLHEVKPGEVLSRKRFNAVRGTWEQLSGEYIRWCGHDAFVQYIADITANEKRQLELQNILEAEDRQLAATQLLNEPGPIGERLNGVLRLLGEYYGADRTYLFRIDGERTSNLSEWCRAGVEPQIDNLQDIDVSYMRRWLPALESSRCVMVPDIEVIRESEPDEYGIMSAQSIRSYAEAPVFIDGRLRGFLGADNPSAEKLLHSGDLLLAFAYSVASALARAQSESLLENHTRELEESQRQLRDAINKSDIQYFTYFPEQHRLEIYVLNEHYSSLPTEWDNYPDSFIAYMQMSPADGGRFREMIRQIDAGEDEASCLTRMSYQGNWLWIKAQYTAVRDESGRTVRALGYANNVTAQREAEERLQNERVRIKSFEGSTFEVFSFNLTKNTQAYFHTTDTKMLSTPVDEAIIREADRLVPPIDRADAETRKVLYRAANRIPDPADRALYLRTCSGEGIRRMVAEGRFKTDIRCRCLINGLVHWVALRVEILPEPATGDLFAFYYASDINDEVIREKITEQIIGSTYRSVLCFDLQTGRFSVRSTEDEIDRRLEGLRIEEAAAQITEQGMQPEEAENYRGRMSLETVTAALESSPVYTLYYTRRERCETLPGRPNRRLKCDARYLDEHRDVIVFLVSDVTEIFEQERGNSEKMAAALREAESANRAKSVFLSRISHDIRTPMNVINSKTSFAFEDLDDREKLQKDLSDIQASSTFLLSLINDILDISKIDSGTMELHRGPYAYREFVATIRSMFEPLCLQKKLRLEIVDEGSADILVDRVRLNQVALNLLSNAVKYTPAGGTVTLYSGSTALPGGQRDCVIGVRDTGIGMSEEFQRVMFEPFTRETDEGGKLLAEQGTGLGLSIVRRIVDFIGGTITVKSAPGQGTDIAVRFVCPEAVLPESGTPERDLRPDERLPLSGVVLVAEDHPMNAEIAQRLLESFGLRTVMAENGAQAVERFDSAPPGTFAAILMDIQMPVMNGYEATRSIRALARPDAAAIPIIAMTADAYVEDVERCRRAGMNGHIAKPIDAGLMYRTLAAAITPQGGAKS